MVKSVSYPIENVVEFDFISFHPHDSGTTNCVFDQISIKLLHQLRGLHENGYNFVT
jgi:hypothetical protein